MISLPQTGGCLCGATRYVLREAPLVSYACHCTDCQTESGSAWYVALVCRAEALEYVESEPAPSAVTLLEAEAEALAAGGHDEAAGVDSAGDASPVRV